MILQIPLIATPSQTLRVTLGAQSCQIDVFQKSTGLYLNLYVVDAPIVLGVLCLHNVRLVREAYLGFAGDLYFLDTQGTSDPDYTGLGGRFVLLWTDAT